MGKKGLFNRVRDSTTGISKGDSVEGSEGSVACSSVDSSEESYDSCNTMISCYLHHHTIHVTRKEFIFYRFHCALPGLCLKNTDMLYYQYWEYLKLDPKEEWETAQEESHPQSKHILFPWRWTAEGNLR